MSDSHAPLETRWSILDNLRGPDADAAWHWFIDRYRGYVRAVLSSALRGRGDAERATDEIWGYLYTSAVVGNADRDRRFRSYLAGVVRNFAREWRRKNPSVASPEVDDRVAPGADPSATVGDEDLRLWKSHVVALALGALEARFPDQVRVLRWFYGLPDSPGTEGGEPRSTSWIARELDLEPNAVHQIVFRGRKRLRSCIENEVRETVRDQEGLDEELRLVYGAIEAEHPGLGG